MQDIYLNMRYVIMSILIIYFFYIGKLTYSIRQYLTS